jgi:hypothetical protein
MKIIFYSEQCEYSKKLIAYLDKNNIKNIFKLVNIDNIEAPKEIDIVPYIIDTELNQPMKGKKAFEYLLNLKYFNNPTNNIEYINQLPPNPNIPEDEKAINIESLNLEITEDNLSKKFYESNINKTTQQATNEMVKQRTNQDNKLAILMKMRRK